MTDELRVAIVEDSAVSFVLGPAAVDVAIDEQVERAEAALDAVDDLFADDRVLADFGREQLEELGKLLDDASAACSALWYLRGDS